MPAEPSPAYELEIHAGARRELYDLPTPVRDDITDRLLAASETRQPASIRCAKSLNDHERLFRIRAGDYRAVCALERPTIFVLAIDERERIYDRLDIAKNRYADAATPATA